MCGVHLKDENELNVKQNDTTISLDNIKKGLAFYFPGIPFLFGAGVMGLALYIFITKRTKLSEHSRL